MKSNFNSLFQELPEAGECMAFTANKAILMDWDGTVVDGMPYKSRQFAETLRKHAHISGENIEKAEKLYLDTAGEPLENQFKKALQDMRVHTNLSDLVASFHQAVREHLPSMFEGAREALLVLAGEGRVLVIVSSAPRDEIELILRSEGLQDAIAQVTSKDNTEQVIEHLQCVRGIPLRDMVLIGDARYDMELAKRFGLTAIGFGRTQSRAALRAAGGDLFAENWTVLLRMLTLYRAREPRSHFMKES